MYFSLITKIITPNFRDQKKTTFDRADSLAELIYPDRKDEIYRNTMRLNIANSNTRHKNICETGFQT